MARDDRSQTGAREGIASDVEGARGAPRGDESYRSKVGLESVAELDETKVAARPPLDTGDRDERIDTREITEESEARNEDAPPPTGARRTEARGGSGGGRNRPTNDGASATSGRSGSHRAAKEAGHHQMNATIRGAGSSGEQRGATTGPRKATRTAASETRGTAKPGIRRGSSKSRSARRAGLH